MHKLNVLVALSAAALMAGGASAKEKPDEPKPRKICRTEHMPGRITPKRICREVAPSDRSGESDQSKSAEPRQAGNGRD